jgi:hypothetical protein
MPERDRPPPDPSRADRTARRAAALRANLARRKAQRRAREEAGQGDADRRPMARDIAHARAQAED